VEYRISTIDEHEDSFGQNPRLEFPRNAQQYLENWFIETNDFRGPRLELRFSRPDAMDTNIWSSLAEKDQVLIAGLISSMPIQFADLSKTEIDTSAKWPAWTDLALSIATILAVRAYPQLNKPA